MTAGLGQLSVGVNQLADGSSQVTGGLGTLSVGVNQMTGRIITQLAGWLKSSNNGQIQAE